MSKKSLYNCSFSHPNGGTDGIQGISLKSIKKEMKKHLKAFKKNDLEDHIEISVIKQKSIKKSKLKRKGFTGLQG